MEKIKRVLKEELLWPDNDHKAFVDWINKIYDYTRRLEKRIKELEEKMLFKT